MDYFAAFLAKFPEINIVFQIARAVGILFDLLLLFAFLFAFRSVRRMRPKFVYNPVKWERYLKKKKKASEVATPMVASAWSRVQAKVQEGTPDAMRLAIVEADGVVDEVLKRMDLPGETFADRLARLNPEYYVTLEKLWDAHRVRNNLVHTPDFQISAGKAADAISAYEDFLKEAKALGTPTAGHEAHEVEDHSHH